MNDAGGMAEALKQACLEAALAAYEDAGVRGLCGEGRWEAAIDALRALDAAAVLERRGIVASEPVND